MRVFSAALAQRSLRYFLACSAGITLVLVPMVLISEHGRRQMVQARLEGLLQAGSNQVNFMLLEATANMGVILTVQSFRTLTSAANPSPAARATMAAVFRSQIREYPRFAALGVVNQAGEPLVMVQRKPGPSPTVGLAGALAEARQSRPSQIWFSRVTWNAPGQATLWAIRPAQDRKAFLVAQVSLTPLAGEFDRITNAAPTLQQGYLLTSAGQVVNQPPGMRSGAHFAARFPQVWRAIQQGGSGVVESDTGLFLHLTRRLGQDERATGQGGLLLFNGGLPQRRLAVVIQVPRDALYRSSILVQPAGQTVVLLLYLLAAGASAALAFPQQRLEQLRQEQRRLLERMETVNESAGVGMGLCDPVTGGFLTVNPALCAFFVRTPEALMACTWEELTHPDDLAADQPLAERLQPGAFNSYRLRKRFLSRDGSTKWGDLVVACTRNNDGSVRELIVQITDVTELVEKTTDLEAASSAGVIGVWNLDLRSNALRWDAQMFRLYGLSQAQGTSTGTYELWEKAVHPDDREMAVAALQSAINGTAPFHCQFRVVWPDHSVHDIRARGTVLYSRDGVPERMVGVNYEVTELVRKSAFLEAASSAGVVGVWDWDIASGELTWDAVMCRLYGLRDGEFSNTLEAWEQAVHPEDKARVLADLEAAQHGWREYQPRFRVVWPDGSIHWLQARSRTTHGPNGTARRMIGVNYEITELVERELEVEQQRAQLATTLDALLDPLLFLTLETAPSQVPILRIAEANPAACGFLGRSHAQLVGQPLPLVLREASNGELHRALLDVSKHRSPWIADEHPIQLEGSQELIYADIRAVASRDGVVLSFRDVSQRRLDAARIAESEERFRLLAENAGDAVFLNTEGIMRWMSPAITPMLGWRPNDWIGHQFMEFCHPDDIPLALQRRAEIMAGATCVTRLRMRDQAGAWRWVEVHSSPLPQP
jgi:PAS domain S-box-containing protein